ncbi:hypothetical protein UF75_2776 [Desulfosporosinus sp. I2]|uniref:hypothetical protein n=1 Tax=Desulfosporosinus sp. I2 TaxID=1617025 RepID=UPI0005EF5EBE|nr:hypothetical protein [Desulfosporosinus sp. I2]KJR46847.1 hypothetical protein UF75_2776 [Desulfosporosinus sp. I2]
MIEELEDFGVRNTRGRFLTVEPVPVPECEGNHKFVLYNNRAKTKRPVATLTTRVGTVLLSGNVKPSFVGTLAIRPDVPFSQKELQDLPADVATLMFRVLGGNPLEEKFIVKITCPILDDQDQDDDEEEVQIISESWIDGTTNFKHYSIFTGRSVIMPSG